MESLKQHRGILSLLLLSFLSNVGFKDNPEGLARTNFKVVPAVVSGVLIALSEVVAREGFKKTPLFWRLVLSFGFLYFTLLFFLLFQSCSSARCLIKLLDNSLGLPLVEKSYAGNCTFSTENLLDKIDVYVLGHCVGWYFKGLLLQEYFLCWFLSCFFELMELSLSFQLENFQECWWDSLFLDVLLCNGLGIHLGIKTGKWLNKKEDSFLDKFFYPVRLKRWVAFNWNFNDSFRNYLIFLFLVIIVTVCDLNFFYLKYLLYIPPPHWLNLLRVLLHSLMGLPALQECYLYLYGEEKALGAQAWLSLMTISLEVVLCWKFGRSVFLDPVPPKILKAWKVSLLFVVLYPLFMFQILPRVKTLGGLRKRKTS